MDNMMNQSNPLLMNNNEGIEQEGQMEDSQEGGQEESGLSFTSEEIEKGLSQQFSGDELSDLEQLVNAGNQILFGKDTHYQIIDGFKSQGGEELAQELAHGAVGLTKVIIQESGDSVPPKLIAPAATILMARVAEYLNKTGMANVTDDVFEEAMHIYSVKLMADHDPEFAKKAGYGQDDQQPEQQPEQQAIPQQGGLLNQGQGGM